MWAPWPGGLGDCGVQLTSSLPFTETPQRHSALSRAELGSAYSFQTAFVLPKCGPEQSHFQRTEQTKWRREALILPANLSEFSKNASENVLYERGAGTCLLFSCDYKDTVHTVSECHEDVIHRVSRKGWWESKWGNYILSGTAREIGVEGVEPEKEGLLSNWLAIWSLVILLFPSVPKGKKTRKIFPSVSTAGIVWWSLVKHVGSGKQV